MDVHRARFVPYPTSAISCVAFSRSNDSGYHNPPSLKLAVGRTSGSIEIWSPNHGNWYQETILDGDGRSVDGLAWTQDPDESGEDGLVITGQQRLFSIASSADVTEWDLATGSPKRKSTGNFSEVWCFAVQPRRPSQKPLKEEERQSQEIVAGCGDGTIVLLSTADNDLQFKRFLARVSGKKARCMCVTYQSQDVVVAGFADSMIRVYNARTGQQVRTMSFGAGLPGAPKVSLVWQVKCLPNGDIVSADSNGEVRIWDRRTFSLVQRIHGHDADCLDLVISSDGQTIFSGSIDGKIAVYKQSQAGGTKRNWAKISGRGIHHGDVKAMAAFDSKTFSVVVLGGSGVAPMLFPLRDYGKAYPRSLSNLPQRGPIISAPKARLLVSWWNEEISIWHIRTVTSSSEISPSPNAHRLVARMALSGGQPIRNVAITTDGEFLAAATAKQIKLFHLEKKSGSDKVSIRKINIPSDFASLGARLLHFSPDGKWLAAISTNSEVHMSRFTVSTHSSDKSVIAAKTIELERQHRSLAQNSAFKVYDRSITHASFSSDSSIFATGDRSGYTDSWILQGQEDLSLPSCTKLIARDSSPSDNDSDSSSSDDDEDDEDVVFYGQYWKDNPSGNLVPRLDSAPLILSFRPPQPRESLTQELQPDEISQNLFVMTAKHDIYELDMVKGGLTPWCLRNKGKMLPPEVAIIKDRAMGAVWDVTVDRQRIWIYGMSWIFMLNLAIDHKLKDGPDHGEQDSRKRELVTQDEIYALQQPAHKKVKKNTAAGGEIPDRERAGFRAQARRFDDRKETKIDLNDVPDTYIEESGELDFGQDVVDMVDESPANAWQSNDPLSREMPSSDEDEEQLIVRSGDRPWWHTFEFRPILGMVALMDSDDSGDDDRDQAVEVAIVERPVWEATDPRAKS